MKTNPLVSICIPTYNGERFLKETLQSVLNQSYQNTEILISDHTSNDASMQIVESFSDTRIRTTVLEPGGGASANWNAAVAKARGEYIKLVCQDDILRVDCIEKQVAVLSHEPLSSFCFSPRDIISPKGRTLLRSRGYVPKSTIVQMEDTLPALIESGTNTFGEPCAILMRTKSLIDAGDFSGTYLIDLGMWIRLWEQGSAVYLPESLSGFRISKGSWTTALRREQSHQISEFFTDLQRKYSDLVSLDSLKIGIRRSRKLQFQRQMLTTFAELGRI